MSLSNIVLKHKLDKRVLMQQLVSVDKEFSNEDYNDWFCISIKPFQCTTCKETICYCVAGPHFILIFPTRDCDDVLVMAQLLHDDENSNYDPHVTRYNHILGSCISWDQALEYGWMLSN